MLKKLYWMGATLDELRAFPDPIQQDIGYALELAQKGEKHSSAKPLKGFKGASVLEIVASHDTNTWRAVYTVKVRDCVYVLHVFQKKSKSDIATPKRDMDLINARLQSAREHAKDQTP